jgi:beta-aspartyl-peptidase (threonine type)
MMKVVLSKWATDRVGYGDTPAVAAREAIHYLHRRVHGHGGIILLDRQGRTGVAHNTPRMAWGVRRSSGIGCAIEASTQND